MPGLSDGDREAIEERESAELATAGMRVFLVLTIYEQERSAWAAHRYRPSHQLNWAMGRYKIALSAYVAEPVKRSPADENSLYLIPRHKGWNWHRAEKRTVCLYAPAGIGIENLGQFAGPAMD